MPRPSSRKPPLPGAPRYDAAIEAAGAQVPHQQSCPSCGAMVALASGQPCPACGVPAPAAQAGAPPPQPATAAGYMSPKQAQDYTMWTHLSAFVALLGVPSPLGPLVMWLVRRDYHPYIDAHGKEALNFNLSAFLYVVVFSIVGFVFSFVTFGFGLFLFLPLFFALGIAWIVFVIIAAVRASKGELYRYPLTIRFVS